ncbi:MAG: DUF6789 family protein [Chloroflexota bacterium]
MEWDAGAAVLAGIVGTLVMTAVLYAGKWMLPEQMPMDILRMQGTMMTRNVGAAYVIGAMTHTVMGIIFALIHTALYHALGIEEGLLGWGILFGAVHWVIARMGFSMMGAMHPLMKSGEMTTPGPFAKNYPMMTVVGFLMLHVIYGLVVGSVYEGIVFSA